MGKLIIQVSLSIDGFFEGPDHDLSWHLVDEELHYHFNEQLAPMGAFLSGRVTYETMADFWPAADADPDAPGPMVEFARIWRDMPKIVYSRTLEQAGWNTTIVRDVVPAEVRQLKADVPGDLVLGGADVAEDFLRHDLVDEFRLYMHPVLLGRGTQFFRSSYETLNLRQVESRTFGNGVVLLRYERPQRQSAPPAEA